MCSVLPSSMRAVMAALVLAACATPAIDDTLSTDDTKLPDRTPVTEVEGGSGNPGLAAEGGTAPMAAPVTLTVTLAGPGTVTSAPSGLTCAGTTCKGSFPSGTSVTLTATPTAGALFAAWSGTCTGATPTCTTKLTADGAATATFTGLDGTWSGTYTNDRMANGCAFKNAGNLTVVGTLAGPALSQTANVTGLELRAFGSCQLVGTATGASPSSAVTVTAGTLTGTWNMNVQGGGSLAFPFTAKVAGKTMTGSWTCTGCTGTFTLTKP